MMDLDKDKVITFEDGSKFVVASSSFYDNTKYHYLVEVDEGDEFLKDSFKIVKEVKLNNETILKKVSDKEELETVSKFLANNL